METQNSPAMIRLCRRMKLLTRALQAMLAAGLIYAAWTTLFRPDGLAIWLADALDLNVPVTITPAIGLVFVAIAIILAGLVFAGLQTVWQLFDRLQRERPFSYEAAALLRRAGLIALTCAIAGMVLRPVATLLATLANPPGARAISIGVGSDQLILLLLAGFLFVMGHVMVLATSINEDYERFV
jgi:DUF2975 family protein